MTFAEWHGIENTVAANSEIPRPLYPDEIVVLWLLATFWRCIFPVYLSMKFLRSPKSKHAGSGESCAMTLLFHLDRMAVLCN